jgi:hypothetical protein
LIDRLLWRFLALASIPYGNDPLFALGIVDRGLEFLGEGQPLIHQLKGRDSLGNHSWHNG